MADDTIDSQQAEIDVEKLLSEIREKVARRDGRFREPAPGPASVLTRDSGMETETGLSAISAVRSAISVASTQADVGAEVSPMREFPVPIRWMALLVGKMVVYLSKFMTDKQRAYNGTVVYALAKAADGLESVQRQLALIDRERTEMRRELAATESRQREMKDALASLKTTQDKAGNALANLKAVEKETRRVVINFKMAISQQERRLGKLMEDVGRRSPESFTSDQLQVTVNEEKHLLDAFYGSFEEEFRGCREEIKERMRIYLPLLKGAGIGSQEMPILDLGCGRGEWLELLQEEEFNGRGVDHNRLSVEYCRDRGFNVAEGDIIHYLKNLPDSSLGAVTGFHIIEHLPFEALVNLVDEVVRTLKPGGCMILETPNPENILVGSCYFYLDPTHNKPLPSPLMKFVAEARGLSRVEIMSLHPSPGFIKLSGSDLDRFKNDYLFGPRDYAVIGWKA